MPPEPPSPSPSQKSRSTRFSQKLRSLKHLGLGTNGPEKEKAAEREFQVVHTPDRPTRLVSALEAPTEEECLNEIQGWHSAAERTQIGVTQHLQPQSLPQQHMVIDRGFEAHGDSGEILHPLAYISPARRDSFITDDGDDVGDIEDLSDWDRSPGLEDPHPTQTPVKTLSKLFRYSPNSTSQPRPKSPDTPEEQFKLELETLPAPPPKGKEPLSEEQMTRLWAHLRKKKDSEQRSEPRSVASFSCFSGSDEWQSHYGEVHQAKVVDLEQLKRVDEFRRGTCPYCHKAILDFKAIFCTFCRADLRSCRGQNPPQTISTSATAHPRPERRYDLRRPYTTEGERKATHPPGSSPPKPLQYRPVLDQSLGGSKKGSQSNLKGSHSEKQPQAIQGASKGTPWIPDPRYNERGMSGGQPGGQPPAYYHGQGGTKTGYSLQSMVPAHVVEGANAIEAKRLDDMKCNQRERDGPSGSNIAPPSPLYSSSVASSSSSISSTDSRQPPSRLRPPPRLAHRAVLADLKPSSSSSTKQLQTRPPPPPPERTFYADGSKNTTTRQTRPKPQQSKPHTRDTNESGNTHTPPSPSPLRHEITGKGETNPHKKATHPSRPPPPAAQYLSPPPPPPSLSYTSSPPTRPPNRPLPTPKIPPQRANHPHGYAIPASSGVSSTSRPNQSRPLNPEQLRPVPHQPNHPSPLLSDSFLPSRASPPTPTPSMFPYQLTTALSKPQQRPPPPTPNTSTVKPKPTPHPLTVTPPLNHPITTKYLPHLPQSPPLTTTTNTQKFHPPSIESLATSDSSAQVPVFRYDSWMTPEQRAEYERQISEHGDNADMYMDIFDDYVSDGEREREKETALRHHRRRTAGRGE